jgi:hypothetical protein
MEADRKDTFIIEVDTYQEDYFAAWLSSSALNHYIASNSDIYLGNRILQSLITPQNRVSATYTVVLDEQQVALPASARSHSHPPHTLTYIYLYIYMYHGRKPTASWAPL